MKLRCLSAKLITTFNKAIRNIGKNSLTALFRIEPKFTIDDQVTRPCHVCPCPDATCPGAVHWGLVPAPD